MTAWLPRWSLVPLAVALLLGLRLAADGRLSGDEPGYLYAAAYQTVPQILAGDVQPTGVPGYLQGRVLHVLLLKGVMTMTGAGPAGFRALQVIHIAIVTLNLLLIGGIARRLLPQVAAARVVPMVLAMTPIALYFALKTTADNEALLAALVATWGMLRIASGRGASGTAAVILGLTAAALIKNQMIFVPVAFWIAACMLPIAVLDRRRLVFLGSASGIAAAVFTVALLEALGIGFANYLESYAAPFANRTPLGAKVLNLAAELGFVWLLVAAAFLTDRRRDLGFFLLWFVASMTPFLFMSGVEPRHVSVNLAAAGGLVALALEALVTRWGAWNRLGTVARTSLTTVGVLVVMASNAVALAIMPHKVDLGALGDALSGLDARYGAGRYALIVSNGYADFHILRVLWPEREVLNAGSSEYAIDTSQAPRDSLLKAYLGDQLVDDLDALARIEKPKVFFGFRHTFAAANLEAMLSAVSPTFARRLLRSVQLDEHLFTEYSAWLWKNPEVRLAPVLRSGNYQALEIHLQRPGG